MWVGWVLRSTCLPHDHANCQAGVECGTGCSERNYRNSLSVTTAYTFHHKMIRCLGHCGRSRLACRPLSAWRAQGSARYRNKESSFSKRSPFTLTKRQSPVTLDQRCNSSLTFCIASSGNETMRSIYAAWTARLSHGSVFYEDPAIASMFLFRRVVLCAQCEQWGCR